MTKLFGGVSVALLLALIVVAPTSAGLLENEVDPGIADGSAARELKDARSLWRQSETRSYRIRISRFCFCAPPHGAKVKVKRGKVVRVSAGKWRGPYKVRGIFKLVRWSIKHEASSLQVKYDEDLGYPRFISVDQYSLAVDDEFSFRVRVKPL